MASVSLIDPYSQQAEEIAKRQRMAQALQEQGSQVLDMPTTPGVLLSPYAGLAKMLQAGIGAYKEKKAREDYAKLQTDYRKNYDTQFENFARALSAPAQEAFAGQEAVPSQEAIAAQPAVMAPQIEKSFGGYGMPREVGQYEVSPAVASKEAVSGQAAIPARPALPAGYIGPETLKGFDIPEVKQLAMAKYLAQFEPKQVKLGQNERLLEQTGSGPFRELAGVSTTPKVLEPKWEATVQKINGVDTPGWINVNAGADKAASTFVAGGKPEKIAAHWEATTQKVNGKDVPGWINLNAADKAASFVAGAKPTEVKAATPHWVVGQKDVNGTTQFGWYDLNAADKDASFKAGANPPAGEKSNWKEVTRGNQVFYEDFNVADAAKRQAGAIAKEAVKTPPHYSEIEQGGNVVIVDMSLPAKDRLANAQVKGPVRNNLEKIETNDANGRPVTRYVDKTELAKLGDIPQQYTGLLLEMAQAGQLKPGWESDPRVAGVIRDNIINQSGGITPARLADIRVRIAEAAARLGDAGIAFDAKGLTPSLSNLTTLPSGSSAAAAPAAAVARPVPTDADRARAKSSASSRANFIRHFGVEP
jgi:hypothetical protein